MVSSWGIWHAMGPLNLVVNCILYEDAPVKLLFALTTCQTGLSKVWGWATHRLSTSWDSNSFAIFAEHTEP
jgi:hypothetical protein